MPEITADDREWTRPASRPVIAAIVATATTATIVTPTDRPGLGWTITAAATAAAVLALTRLTGTPLRPGWLALGVALMTTAALRDAPWLSTLCTLGAVACLSLSVSTGRSARALITGSVIVWLSGAFALPRLSGGVMTAARSRGDGPRIGRAVAVGVLLLLVFGSLFAAADAAFADLVAALVPELSGIDTAGLAVFTVMVLLLGGVAYPRPAATGAPRPAGRVRLVEWALPVGVLLVLFALFIGVQVAALFGGDAHVTRTTGLTYAEYARSGFWQLLVVTALTLAVIAVAARVAPTCTAAERAWLRGLLGGLTAATLVIVASAIARLWLYQQTYGFTVLRLLVGVAEVWLGLVCLMVLAAGRRLAAAWLPTAVLGSGLAALLGLVVLNPEAFVARWNVQRHADTGRVDTAYLAGLSADAVPALTGLPEPVRGCVLGEHAARLRDDGPAEWNWGRVGARAILLQPHRCAGADARHG